MLERERTHQRYFENSFLEIRVNQQLVKSYIGTNFGVLNEYFHRIGCSYVSMKFLVSVLCNDVTGCNYVCNKQIIIRASREFKDREFKDNFLIRTQQTEFSKKRKLVVNKFLINLKINFFVKLLIFYEIMIYFQIRNYDLFSV